MKPTLYLETTIISYLAAWPSRDLVVAGRQALTVEWWKAQKDAFELFISALVIEESEGGDSDAVRRRMEIIGGIQALGVNQDALSLARMLVSKGVIPEKSQNDALHVSICAINGIEYLLTWNCRHLANATIRRQVEELVEDFDYICPVICTPEELMEDWQCSKTPL